MSVPYSRSAETVYNTDTDDEKNMKKWKRRKSRKTDVNGKITHFIEVDKSLKR